ncbi:MAG TPA: response regulator [Planctomycetota bacterium]|nr:response regulator [Planctomycetota bacterium]
MLSRTVLIAEDDRLLRESLCDVLDGLGCTPHGVDCGGKAIEILERHRFDLVLSDIDMPDMTGFVLLSLINRFQPHPSAVLMSARADRDLERAAHQAGALALLPKPVKAGSLASLLGSLFPRDGANAHVHPRLDDEGIHHG